MNSNIEGFVTSNELSIVKYLAFGTRQLKDESPAFIGGPYNIFAVDFPDDKTYKQFRGCGFNRRNIFIRGVLGFYQMRGVDVAEQKPILEKLPAKFFHADTDEVRRVMAYDKTVNKIVKWIDSRSIFSQKDGEAKVLVSEEKAIELFCGG